MMRPRNCIEELKSGDPYWQKLVEVIGRGTSKGVVLLQFERHFLAARQSGHVGLISIRRAAGTPQADSGVQEHVLRRARTRLLPSSVGSRWSRQANHQL